MTYSVHYKINDFGISCDDMVLGRISCGDMILGYNMQVSIGLVVALNYHNPLLNPYEEFQVSLKSFCNLCSICIVSVIQYKES